MTSNRHNRTAEDDVLDAARDCVLAVGVRRTTLTDVARRAGVSRMTLYRRWPDVRTLIGDLMTREWVAIAEDARGDDLVESLVEGVRAFRAHPLFRRIVDVDPELLLPYMLDRRGASQNALLEIIADALDGRVAHGTPVGKARAILLTVQSFALSLQTMTGDGVTERELLEELRQILDKAL